LFAWAKIAKTTELNLSLRIQHRLENEIEIIVTQAFLDPFSGIIAIPDLIPLFGG
jgi:hypothetical protein